MELKLDQSIYHLIDFDTRAELTPSEKNFRMDLLSIVSESLAEMAELKDEQTGYHINRVAILGELVANTLKKMGTYDLSDAFIKLLKFTIPLHDIGKVGINDAILLKPGKLTADEYRVMQSHSIIGAHILEHLHERIKIYNIEYFKMAANIARYHHEKFDGNGYPAGLQGDDIPLEAQITALVDVFDALMSKRPYKEAFPVETCLEIITQSRGTHFNPVLVDALIGNIDQVMKVYALLKD